MTAMKTRTLCTGVEMGGEEDQRSVTNNDKLFLSFCCVGVCVFFCFGVRKKVFTAI